jgi:hypothetical protein
MGDGWQTRMNAVLGAYVRNDPSSRGGRVAKGPKVRVTVRTGIGMKAAKTKKHAKPRAAKTAAPVAKSAKRVKR